MYVICCIYSHRIASDLLLREEIDRRITQRLLSTNPSLMQILIGKNNLKAVKACIELANKCVNFLFIDVNNVMCNLTRNDLAAATKFGWYDQLPSPFVELDTYV